jgi:tetratricopeptide (TPR) repeat protein
LSEKSKKLFPDALNNIGNLYFRQSNFEKALEFYNKALMLAIQSHDNLLTIQIKANIGEVLSKIGQFEVAQRLLEEALNQSEELQTHIYEPQILKNLATNYAKSGKMKEAYESLNNYTVAVEKIYGEESSRKIAQMELALDVLAKEKELEALKMDEEIANLKLKNITTIITLQAKKVEEYDLERSCQRDLSVND